MSPPSDPDPPSDDAHGTENESASTTDDPSTEAASSTDSPPADSTPAEYDPPTGGTSADTGTADADADDAEPDKPPEETETTSEGLRRTLDGFLPEAGVESNWWYWIAAVPIYFLVALVGGALTAVLFLFAGILDVVGLGGLASISALVVFGGAAALFGLVGVAIAIVFPVAMYIDARAIESVGEEWTPDPVLWGLLAVVAVLVTNFIVSVPLALYYLYKRHEALGTP